MSGRLDLINEKIKRAKEHFRDLEASISAFRTGTHKPYEIATKRDPKTRELVYYVTRADPVPYSIPLITGDVVHNLRSALDHLACHLVEANSENVTINTGFPIFKSANAYKAGFAAKVKGIRKEAIELIHRAKPYKGGNNVLWTLHDLDIVDKHRLLLAVGSTNTFDANAPVLDTAELGSLWKSTLPDDPFPTIITSPIYSLPAIQHCPLKPGHELRRMPPDSEPDKNLLFLIDVALAEESPFKGQPLIETLKQFFDFVERMVYNFAKFL